MESHCYFIAASWGDGAVPKQFRALADGLVSRGHRVVYVTHGQRIRIDDGDFQLYSFPSPRPTKLKDFIFLNRLARQYKPDCMIANFGASNLMTVVGWLNRVQCRVNWYHTTSTANLIDFQGYRWRWDYQVLRKQFIYALGTHIVANSEDTARDVAHVFRVPKSRVTVFYNSVSDVMRITPFMERDPSLIIMPGRLSTNKGQDVLIRALHILKSLNITPVVHFLGTGNKQGDLKLLAEQINVDDQCVFEGRVPHAEMFRRMALAAFTVVPSRSEAFGMVNIESMSVGTPVIASDVGGIPEIIRDGVDGFLVPPDDPAALADKMMQLLTDSELRESMGRNARQRFLDMFELEKNVDKQVEWFESLVRTYKKH